MIRVFIKIGVSISYGSIRHSAVSLCLVGFILDVVFHNGSRVFQCSQYADFQTGQDFPFEFSLEFQVGYAQIHIVILQLMHNVKRSIVTGIKLIGIQGSGSVQSITVGVDIERTFYFPVYGICFLGQGTGSSLVTESTATDQVQGQVFVEVIGRVQVNCIALNLALF